MNNNKNAYFSAINNDPKRSNDTFNSSKSERIFANNNNNNNSTSSNTNDPINSVKNSKTKNDHLSNKKIETQRLIMSNHKLNKKEYSSITVDNCHRSSSTRSVNRKLKFRVN